MVDEEGERGKGIRDTGYGIRGSGKREEGNTDIDIKTSHLSGA